MIRYNLDREWHFKPGNTSNDWWVEIKSTVVDLPHDFSIIQKRDPNTPAGPTNGYFPGGVGVYRKSVFIPEEWKGKKVLVEFEGVYMNATVRFNGNIVAYHPYGYTGFFCDLTPYIKYGQENSISVTVNNSALPNTRWYSGSGIYRHVWLLVAENVHIAPWGVYAVTKQASPEKSLVCVRTKVENSGSTDEKIQVRSVLLDACNNEVANVESRLEVAAGGAAEAKQDLEVSPANLWSVDNPYLYTLKSEVIKDGTVIDSTETKIGIRTISFDPKEGFKLNGIPMKLKGGCVHHDCGLLGAASYDRAEERKVELMKSCGYNAVRCAHNPPSPAFLDACDRLGMLVIDEAFDCWREGKNPNDYSVHFENWWMKDIESMVLRDRNHPSVIMWSTGNEIPERDGRSDGYAYSRKLADFIRSLDNTRAITHALNNIVLKNGGDDDHWGKVTSKFVEPLDVVGYNYMLERYEMDGKKFPGRIIYGSESYPKQAYENWSAVERLPYVIGDFVWTAWDYLGEAGLGHIWYNGEKDFLGKYPWHQAFCGDIDICGFRRPQSYYRSCVWGLSTEPYIAVHKPEYYGKTPDISDWGWPDVASSWTWPGYEGKPVKIDVYSTDDEVELILNGKSIGRKPAGKAEKYIASFETIYEAGELTAIGYKNGVEVSRSTLKTAGKPASIRLTPDRNVLKARFGDLSYITVEVVDSEGNVVHNATNNIYFTAYGVGSLLAVGSGNPVTEEMYVGNQRRVHEGRAMVVVRANGEEGRIILTATAEGLPAANAVIEVKR